MASQAFAAISFVPNLTSLPSLIFVNLGIQWLGWGVATLFKTEKFYDLTGSLTHILLACVCYSSRSSHHPRQKVQTFFIVVWAIRLGLYLFFRILATGGDRRFNKIKTDSSRFFFAWTMQGVWVTLNLLPSLLCLTSRRQLPLGHREYIGWGMWLMGFLIETVADYQKTAFRNNPANEGKFVNTGLWALSRHPNYFGEIFLWFGLYVSASSTLTGHQYFTVLCPTLVYLLITRLSGIPPLERYAKAKWGASPAYQTYLSNTPELVPFWF